MKKSTFFLAILCLALGVVFAQVALAQQAGSASGKDEEVPFSVRDQFFQRNGISWLAATPEQRAEFLTRVTYEKPTVSTVGRMTVPIAKGSPTLNAPFVVKNSFFNQYGVTGLEPSKIVNSKHSLADGLIHVVGGGITVQGGQTHRFAPSGSEIHRVLHNIMP